MLEKRDRERTYQDGTIETIQVQECFGITFTFSTLLTDT